MNRVTRKMMNSNSIYNINTNKAILDKKNTQMATQKKYVDPSDDPITAIRSLRFKGNYAEVSQYLDRNVSDAVSWNESTMTAIDTAREIMTSLKAEYTSAANGTNEIKDREIYLQNAENLVNEYFGIGNSTMESRYLFTGYRTENSLTFSQADFDARKEEGGTFKYVGISETFHIEDIESYSFTERTDHSGSGVSDDELTNLTGTFNELDLKNVQAYRLRLSYKELDAGISHSLTGINFTPVEDDYQIPENLLDNTIYYNKDKGTLIFGEQTRTKLVNLMKDTGVSIAYNKSTWKVGDAKPEYYFNCMDVGITPNLEYKDHEQKMEFNMGDSQSIQINANASDVFTLQAKRDIDELKDVLRLHTAAQKKVERLRDKLANKDSYTPAEQDRIRELLYAAEKEMNYTKDIADDMFKSCMGRADKYYAIVNKASTDAGTVAKRLELISKRLSADKITVETQTSENENVDLSTLAVEVSEASLLYSAALQVTGKIGQQTLINYI